MRNKDTILLEQAYAKVLEEISSRRAKEMDALRFTNQQAKISEDEANSLIRGFHMLPSFEKGNALIKLRTLVGKEVSLSRATRLKQSTGYGKDDGSATVPGSGGSVAHTVTDSIDSEFARGIIQDVKQSFGEDDYTKEGNLILKIKDQEYNVSQGTTVKVKFLEDSPAEVHAAAGRSFRSGAASWPGHGRFSGMKR